MRRSRLLFVALINTAFISVAGSYCLTARAAELDEIGERSAAKLHALDTCIVRTPRDPKAWMHRGQFYAAAGLEEKALADFARALQLDPKDCETYYCRADTYMKTEEFAKARDDYIKSGDLHEMPGGKAIAYRNAGRAIAKLGKHADAVKMLTRALALADPGSKFSILLARANSYLALKKYKEAIADVDAMRPPGKLHDEPALAVRAVAEISLEKYDAAIADLTQAIKLTGKKATSLENMVFATNKDIYFKQRAMCYQKLGQMDLANADMRRAAKAQQDSLDFAPFR